MGTTSKPGIKIVTIGGGSSYTPELMEGFIKRYDELPIREIWLVDVEEGREKVETVGAMAQRMWKAAGHDVEIHVTLDRREALPGADFVTTQFRVGFLYARIKDERIPLAHGMLGQETNGAGGMFKAFRTIPVIGQIIDDMRELCPEAWLINFTNPSGMVTEAAIKRFGWKRTVGLCNIPVISMMKEPALIGRDPEELTWRFAGLNHFHWHKVYDQTGADITQELIDHVNDPDGPFPANIFSAAFPIDLLHSMGLMPCGYHRYYYMADEMLGHCVDDFKINDTRAEHVKEVEDELFALYRDPNLDHKPPQLAERGGAYYSDAACECISAIYNDKHEHMVVSTENRGAISELDPTSIVEVSSIISAKGAEPIAWGKMPVAERGWLQLMKAMEELTIEAALTGDYGVALQAFTINPVVAKNPEARAVLNQLLLAHERYLPQFADAIQELKDAGERVTDPVVLKLMAEGK